MTDSPNKKSKEKHYRIEPALFGAETYLETQPDEREDEDAIDRLLLYSGFDIDNEDEDIMAEDFKEPETIHHDFDTSLSTLTMAPELYKDEQENSSEKTLPDPFIQDKSDQESTTRQQELLIESFKKRLIRSSVLAYVALAIAVTTMAAAIVLSMFAYHAHKEISRLSDIVSVIEEDTGGTTDDDSGNESSKADLSFKPVHPANKDDASLDKRVIKKMRPPVANQPTKNDVTSIKAAPTENYPKSAWFANLISFKRRGDAELRAAEFIKKGVRAEIIEVEVNDATWYRLRVGGFNNREKATAYVEKIKKTLQLKSVWIDHG